MNKRVCRSLAVVGIALSTVALPHAASPTHAQAPQNTRIDAGVWRISAEISQATADGVVLRRVRLASPTTYVIAERATLRVHEIKAERATVHVRDWVLPAATLQVDSRQDAVQITPRVRAHQE